MTNFKNKVLKLFNLEVCCNHNFKRDSQIKIVTCTKCNKVYWYDLPDNLTKL